MVKFVHDLYEAISGRDFLVLAVSDDCILHLDMDLPFAALLSDTDELEVWSRVDQLSKVLARLDRVKVASSTHDNLFDSGKVA